MKKILPFAMLLILFVMAGCGGGGGDNNPPPSHEVTILSDAAVDGFVVEGADPPFPLTVYLTTPTLFAGVDPVTGNEYRAFIDVPLDDIPDDAVIESATLEIKIKSVALVGNSVPIQLQLVSFTPPIRASYFDLLPVYLTTEIVPPIRPADVGQHLVIDVTPLMQEAQRRRLSNFQLRVLEALNAADPGLIEIDESSADTAPLLDVVYH